MQEWQMAPGKCHGHKCSKSGLEATESFCGMGHASVRAHNTTCSKIPVQSLARSSTMEKTRVSEAPETCCQFVLTVLT